MKVWDPQIPRTPVSSHCVSDGYKDERMRVMAAVVQEDERDEDVITGPSAPEATATLVLSRAQSVTWYL